MRVSTKSLLVQLDHLWAMRAAVTRLAAGSVLETADELGSHLDGIRRATTDCSDIAGAAGKARDHSLRYILRCHQGEPTEELRSDALRSIDELEDEILRFKVVDEEPVMAMTADALELSHTREPSPASYTIAVEAVVLRGGPLSHLHPPGGFYDTQPRATMP